MNETVRVVTFDGTSNGRRDGVILDHFDSSQQLVAVEYLSSQAWQFQI